MNRVGLGLAVGAGYLLGRTKKLKMAMAVGGMVAGKKMNLSPRMVADVVQQQLRNNPQFKEIGDQLRQDLRGVGKAASGAMVERQIDAIADRLHGRTAQVRDQLSGVVPGKPEADAEDAEDEEPEAEDSGPEEDDEEPEPAPKEAAKKAPAKKAPAKNTARKAPAKKAPAKKTAGKKAAAKKTTAGNRGGSARARLPKGGGE
jgi:hypothetical protein